MPTVSESLKDMAMTNFPEGFTFKPLQFPFLNDPPQTSMLDLPLVDNDIMVIPFTDTNALIKWDTTVVSKYKSRLLDRKMRI